MSFIIGRTAANLSQLPHANCNVNIETKSINGNQISNTPTKSPNRCILSIESATQLMKLKLFTQRILISFLLIQLNKIGETINNHILLMAAVITIEISCKINQWIVGNCVDSCTSLPTPQVWWGCTWGAIIKSHLGQLYISWLCY